MQIFREWYKRYFYDPQVMILAVLLIFGFVVVFFFGKMLAPALTAVVLAYFLEGAVSRLEKLGLKRIWSVLLVFTTFMTFAIFALVLLLPLLSQQIQELFRQVPIMIASGQRMLMQLPERYPTFITESQIADLMAQLRSEMTSVGQRIWSISVSSALGLVKFSIFSILVPLMLFFFLKDKERILAWGTSYLPEDRELSTRVWGEVDAQIGNYIRGKMWEILIVTLGTFAVFAWMDLQFGFLLAVAVGLSVLVPYVGAVIVTIPVIVVAFFQWGLSSEFWWLFGAYLVVQALDGNIVVPLLFSEVVDLHPTAIIIAILIFCGMWGFWGIFFAIPLATLVNAVLRAWPRRPKNPDIQPVHAEI